MFLIWMGKWWCHFLLLYIAFRKLLYFEALVKTMIPDTFFFPGVGPLSLLPKCSSPSVALFASLFLLWQVQVLCLTRGTQCVQSAAAALLGTWWHWWWIPSKRPLCSGLSEHWMTVPTGLFRLCTAATADGLVQKGSLVCLENTACKPNPQDTTL